VKDTDRVAHTFHPDPAAQPKPSNLILFKRVTRPMLLSRDSGGQLGQNYAENCIRQLFHRLHLTGDIIEIPKEVLRRCLIDAYKAGLGDGCDTVYDAVADRAETIRRQGKAL